jgi:sarcosine oxidase subunit beta
VTSLVSADVCIVGAGLVGAASAYRLAKQGANVIVLERAWPGAGSSGGGMGGFRQQFADAVDAALVRASLPLVRELAPGALSARGYLFIAETDAGLAELAAGVEPMREFGVRVRMVDRSEIAELVPGIVTADLRGGRLGEDDGWGDPREVLDRTIAAARDLGVRVLERQNVLALHTRNGRIASVEATTQTVSATQVLVACGAWTAELLATCGVAVPIWPYRRQIARAGPFPPLREIPMTIEWESGLHFRPKGADQLFSMPNLTRDGTLEKSPRAPAPAPPLVVDPRALAWTQRKAAARHPSFSDLRFAEAWACYYEMTPDDHPIIGAVEEIEGLFIAAGFSGHGFMQSAAVGACVAELLVEGRSRTVDLSDFAMARFRSGASRFSASVL